MATAENIKAFLKKRGFDAEVEKLKDDRTFIIGLSCKTVKEVSNVMAQIEEPGRFIISVQLSDIFGLLSDALNLSSLASKEELMKQSQALTNTDDELKKQSESSISGLWTLIKTLESEIKTRLDNIEGRIDILESKPWWRKW